MTGLVLYHAAPSRSMTVHWMLEEIGVPYDIEWLNLEAEEHKRAEYLAINPMGKVPTLRHGERIVTETAAICTYLAETFPQSGLSIAPESPLRGDYLKWLFFAPVTAEPALLWASLKLPTEQDYQPFAGVDAVAEVLREAVRGRDFIVGNQFTAADVMIGATIMWGTKLMPILPRHPELLEYWARLEERPAWQRSSAVDQEAMSARESQ